MKCKICDLNDNKNDDLGHRQMVYCDLLAVSGKMSSSGVVCSADCIVTQLMLEKVGDMLLRSEIDGTDLDKSSWVNMLPPRFKKHAMALQRLTSKSYDQIIDGCRFCRKDIVQE